MTATAIRTVATKISSLAFGRNLASKTRSLIA